MSRDKKKCHKVYHPTTVMFEFSVCVYYTLSKKNVLDKSRLHHSSIIVEWLEEFKVYAADISSQYNNHSGLNFKSLCQFYRNAGSSLNE